MPASIMQRPLRCVRCGTLTRRAFIVGERYVCDADPCLLSVLRDLGFSERHARETAIALRIEFHSTY